MASVSGSKLSFFAPGLDPSAVNIVLTADGSDAAGKAVDGKFNIEVFTSAAGTLTEGFQASALLQGSTLIDNNTVQVADEITQPEQLLAGTYAVVDETGNEDIRIIGGAAGSSITVVGSSGDTITGSALASTSQTIDLSGLDPTTKAGAMTVIGGAGNTTVTAGSNDVIVGGAGKLGVDGNAGDDNSIVGGAGNFEAFNFGTGNTVTGGSAATFIDDGYGAGGDNLLTGGSGTTTFIQGAAGDTLVGGSAVITTLNSFTFGSQTILGGSGFSTLISGGDNDRISAGGAKTVFVSAGTNTTIFGGSNTDIGALTDVFVVGANDSIVGQAGALTVGGGAAAPNVTIEGGSGNLFAFNLGTGNTVTGSTAGTTFINDEYGAGGNSSLTGGAGGSTILGGAGDTIVGGTGALEAWISTGFGSVTVNLSASGSKDGVRDIDSDTSGTSDAGTNTTVTGFSTADDKIESSTTTGAELIATATETGGNVVLHFNDLSTMTIVGVSLADVGSITFTG